jgi:hypothetical protein
MNTILCFPHNLAGRLQLHFKFTYSRATLQVFELWCFFLLDQEIPLQPLHLGDPELN